jgi:PAS domain S-box-containing protein
MINDAGIIKDVNSAALRIFGYRVDEMVGTNVAMLIRHPTAEIMVVTSVIILRPAKQKLSASAAK